MKKALVLLSAVSVLFAACTKSDPVEHDRSPYFCTWENSQTINLPGTFSKAGTDITLPKDNILSVLGISESEFLSGLGTKVQFGYTTETTSPLKAENVTWQNGSVGGWYDQSGKPATEASGAVYCAQKDKWVWNVNMAEALCGKGNSFKVTQAFQASGADGGTRTVFVKYTITSVQLYDLGTGSSSFSMNTGIVCQTKMVVKDASKEYKPLVLDIPEIVYQTVKAMSPYGYDNLAYFVKSGQIKCYAFPKGGGVGSETQNAWFDKTGAEAATDADKAVNVFLELEPGDPMSGGGKYIYVHFDEQAGALKAGDTIRCGFVFVYGTTKIPMTCLVTIVDKL